MTGGTGYIGAHTVLEMLEAGHEVVVMDNLANSTQESLVRVQKLTGKTVIFEEVDILDEPGMLALFQRHSPDSVIHFAGLKAVGESVAKPLWYYENNIGGTVKLLNVMGKVGCKNIVFSSSATVYGDPASVPVDETFPTSATNPYGRTKLFIEDILRDVHKSDSTWNIILLRYFNPVGAHKSGQLGESPKGIPNNLMPYIQQVAVGVRPHLGVFGSDYPTKDGTGYAALARRTHLCTHLCTPAHPPRHARPRPSWPCGPGVPPRPCPFPVPRGTLHTSSCSLPQCARLHPRRRPGQGSPGGSRQAAVQSRLRRV